METIDAFSRTLGSELGQSKSMWTQLMERTASYEALNRCNSPLKTKVRKIYEFKESSRTVDPSNTYLRPQVRASLTQIEKKSKKKIHHSAHENSQRFSTPAKTLPTDERSDLLPQKRHFFRPSSTSMNASYTASPARSITPARAKLQQYVP